MLNRILLVTHTSGEDHQSNKTIDFIHEKIILKHFFSGKLIFIISSFNETYKKYNFFLMIIPYSIGCQVPRACN